MKYPDLSPYTYRPRQAIRPTENVGWLDEKCDFPTGTVDEYLLPVIWECCMRRVAVRRGCATCRLCNNNISVTYERQTLRLGTGEIRIFGESAVYAAPDLLFHYIQYHKYQPPEVFVKAALGQPMPWTGEYAALLASAVP